MTTKDTREKIARALCNRHLGEGAFDDLLLDTETRIAYLEDADAILEALTATPEVEKARQNHKNAVTDLQDERG